MDKKKPSLVVLAAGMGSRYGGLKQIDAMGPQGEWLLEYALYDAARSGFGEVVFVIRKFFADEFEREIRSRFPSDLSMKFVFQELEDVPNGFQACDGRDKPLGTAHAIWCARNAVKGPFAVINADDFYGNTAIKKIGEVLQDLPEGKIPHEFCMVAYLLKNTLSEHGRVARGICNVSESGILESIEEWTRIYKSDGGALNREPGGEEHRLDPESPVSMNLWGFTPDIFSRLEAALEEFLVEKRDNAEAELFIPFVVDQLIQSQQARVRVYKSASPWFGVTYPEDKDRVKNELSLLIEAGRYPSPLWH